MRASELGDPHHAGRFGFAFFFAATASAASRAAPLGIARVSRNTTATVTMAIQNWSVALRRQTKPNKVAGSGQRCRTGRYWPARKGEGQNDRCATEPSALVGAIPVLGRHTGPPWTRRCRDGSLRRAAANEFRPIMRRLIVFRCGARQLSTWQTS